MLERLQKKLKHLQWLLWANRSMVVVGYLVSATFNVLHAELNFFSILIAIVSPSLLLISFEVGSRIPIPEKPGVLRWIGIGVRIGATVCIAGVTAYVSYFHQKDAFLRWGHDETQAFLLPGAIDAFMITGSVGVMEVQSQMRDLEVKVDGLKDARATRERVVDVVPTEKKLTKRERIHILLRERPEATVDELARLAEASPGYVATVKSELKNKPVPTFNGNGYHTQTEVHLS